MANPSKLFRHPSLELSVFLWVMHYPVVGRGTEECIEEVESRNERCGFIPVRVDVSVRYLQGPVSPENELNVPMSMYTT